MKQSLELENKVLTNDQLVLQLKRWELLSKKVVFTNGVFDILHVGHLKLLMQAASFADILVVGINSDNSVKKLKGNNRPLNQQSARAILVASLVMVDAVVIFDEETPLDLIQKIKPAVLVKGGDYTIDKIVGAVDVTGGGGEVKIIPLEPGFSTTRMIEMMKNETG
ncbi:MAG: D-glycero-beta-D-manno-heptose 1-phosphate adenylyltransferase [Ginsengibacter sp.]